MSLVIGFGLA